MTTFILIVMWVTGGGYGGSAITQEFVSKNACLSAIKAIQQQHKTRVALCVPKGIDDEHSRH